MRSAFVALLLLGIGVAHADVIVVGKREIRGEIVEETDDEVKLRVGNGYLTVEKALIKEIRRESEIDTLAGEARALVKTLDAKAIGVFDRAIAAARAQGENTRADALQKERNAYAVRIEKQATLEGRRNDAAQDEKTAPDDEFLLQADLDEVAVLVKAAGEGDAASGHKAAAKLLPLGQKHTTENEPRWAVGCFALARRVDPTDAKSLWTYERAARLSACGLAVRARDAKIARDAIDPVAKEEPADAHVAYLDGRSQETASNPVGAREAFKRALAGIAVPNLNDLPVDWLRELARKRALGEDVGPGSPGFGEQWRHAETAHFSVYHELGDDFTDDEPQAFEDARGVSLSRLALTEGDVNGSLKVPMFIFKTKDGYVKAGGPEWAAGHVGIVTLEDGDARTVYTYPGRHMETSTMQHELGHVLVAEAYPRLLIAPWANEGVACYCEPDTTQKGRRQAVARAIQAGTFVPLDAFLSRATVPADGSQAAIEAFYGESAVVFAALVQKAGSVKDALEVAARIGRRGPAAGLRELGTDPQTLEAEIKADLGH
jgi:hypothetical protein